MKKTTAEKDPNPTAESTATRRRVREGKSLERLANERLSDEGRMVEEMLDESVLRWKARHDS